MNVGTVFVGRVKVLEEGLEKVGDENNKNDYIDDVLKEYIKFIKKKMKRKTFLAFFLLLASIITLPVGSCSSSSSPCLSKPANRAFCVSEHLNSIC